MLRAAVREVDSLFHAATREERTQKSEGEEEALLQFIAGPKHALCHPAALPFASDAETTEQNARACAAKGPLLAVWWSTANGSPDNRLDGAQALERENAEVNVRSAERADEPAALRTAARR